MEAGNVAICEERIDEGAQRLGSLIPSSSLLYIEELEDFVGSTKASVRWSDGPIVSKGESTTPAIGRQLEDLSRST